MPTNKVSVEKVGKLRYYVSSVLGSTTTNNTTTSATLNTATNINAVNVAGNTIMGV